VINETYPAACAHQQDSAVTRSAVGLPIRGRRTRRRHLSRAAALPDRPRDGGWKRMGRSASASDAQTLSTMCAACGISPRPHSAAANASRTRVYPCLAAQCTGAGSTATNTVRLRSTLRVSRQPLVPMIPFSPEAHNADASHTRLLVASARWQTPGSWVRGAGQHTPGARFPPPEPGPVHLIRTPNLASP
jgi:hypothetical protein